MATIKFRLTDADRERFGGPEWTVWDDHEFLGMDYDHLDALERDMRASDNMTLAKLIVIEWPRRSMIGIRGMLWLSRQLAGATEPGWDDFKPNALLADVDRVEADVVPPPDGSSPPPSEEKPARSKKASPS